MGYAMLKANNALSFSTIVVSREDDLPCKQMLTPYTGAAIADFFKFHGLHSVIVYDDLTVHNRICSKIWRESTGLMTYGNWSGELLERAALLDAKFGGGSHSALCLADKPRDDDELNAESETFFNFLPHLVSHCDERLSLSEAVQAQGLSPPIALFPVPYGTPKFMRQSEQGIDAVLATLSVCVKRALFECAERESAAQSQRELEIDLEPDTERIASNVYKVQVL